MRFTRLIALMMMTLDVAMAKGELEDIPKTIDNFFNWINSTVSLVVTVLGVCCICICVFCCCCASKNNP